MVNSFSLKWPLKHWKKKEIPIFFIYFVIISAGQIKKATSGLCATGRQKLADIMVPVYESRKEIQIQSSYN